MGLVLVKFSTDSDTGRADLDVFRIVPAGESRRGSRPWRWSRRLRQSAGVFDRNGDWRLRSGVELRSRCHCAMINNLIRSFGGDVCGSTNRSTCIQYFAASLTAGLDTTAAWNDWALLEVLFDCPQRCTHPRQRPSCLQTKAVVFSETGHRR